MELWTSLKYLLLTLVCLLVYYTYDFVIKIILVRRKYKQYKNVYVSDKFIPLLGDAQKGLKYQREGKARVYYKVELALNQEGYDMKVFTAGNMVFIGMMSERAFKEFIQKVPQYIDRRNADLIGIGKLASNSMVFRRSSIDWKHRREGFLKHMGINFSSKYIPTMIDACSERFSKLEKGNKYDILKLFNKISFKVITVMLFGKDVNEKVGKIAFELPDGSTKSIPFADYFIEL